MSQLYDQNGKELVAASRTLYDENGQPLSPELARIMVEMEEQAEAFNARYGIDPSVGWTDIKLILTLADHGLPTLASLVPSAEDNRITSRERAAHLLAHQIRRHQPPRCTSCWNWGKASE